MNDLTGVFASATAVFMFAVFLATINERLIEKFVKPVLAKVDRSEWSGHVALGTGLLLTLAFGIDLFSPVAEAVGVTLTVPWAGVVLTGLLVGGGSMFIHDVWPQNAPAAFAIPGETLEVTATAAIEPLPESGRG